MSIMNTMKIKIYGSRGSMPFFNRNNIRYGGNTSCIRVDLPDRIIILDCGSGLAQLYHDLPRSIPGFRAEQATIDILLSHLHIDHLIGLSAFPLLFSDNNIRIHTCSRGNLPLAEQVFGLFNPPYWPIRIGDFNRSKLIEISNGTPFHLGDAKITPLAARHNDNTTCFRIDADKSLVYLLDYEIDESCDLSNLADFCRNADAVIFDATYLPVDYPQKRGWGHSTYEAGVALAAASGAKKMIFSHTGQDYDDTILDMLSDKLCKLSRGDLEFTLAFDGMELII